MAEVTVKKHRLEHRLSVFVLVMIMALMSFSGCGDDDNPVASNDAAAIAGTWGTGYNSDPDEAPYAIMTTYPSGLFIYWMADDPNDSGDNGGGVEIGMCTYNSRTKKVTFECIMDENGWHGMAADCVSFMDDYTVEVKNDTIRSYENGSLAEVIPRVKSDSNPIVGGWGDGYYASSFPEYMSLTFYANGIYILWRSDDPTDATDAAGVEIGTYTYNSSTDEFVITDNIRDDNGSGGLVVNGIEQFPGDWTRTVTIVNDTLRAYEGGDDPVWVAKRVQ